MDVNNKFMKRCIELASDGIGRTYPNPLVGCVIVHNNIIIGEGSHQKYGFNSKWQMMQYVKLFYDKFFEYFPEYKKFKI